jgi:hypothetical protein
VKPHRSQRAAADMAGTAGEFQACQAKGLEGPTPEVGPRGQPPRVRAAVAPASNHTRACCQSTMSEAPLSTTWILSGPDRANSIFWPRRRKC